MRDFQWIWFLGLLTPCFSAVMQLLLRYGGEQSKELKKEFGFTYRNIRQHNSNTEGTIAQKNINSMLIFPVPDFRQSNECECSAVNMSGHIQFSVTNGGNRVFKIYVLIDQLSTLFLVAQIGRLR